MQRILIIEDDPLVADVYRSKLKNEGFAVDVAADGQAGLEIFNSRRPDLVLLDLMLPEVSGLQVLKSIRAQFNPRELPVLVFTNAYLGGVMQQAWEAGANQVIPKAGVRPSLVIQMIQNAMDNPPVAAVPIRKAEGEFDPQVRKKFLTAAPETLAALWQPLKALAAEPDNRQHLHLLDEKIRPLSAEAAIAGLPLMAQLASAFEALLKNLSADSRHVTPSVLLTVAQAIDTLKFLFVHPSRAALAAPIAGRVLVVDDDEFTRLAITRALALVNLKVTAVGDPVTALKRRVGRRFNLILLDIEMPGATGLDLCLQFRAMPAYRKTPIIFLSMHTNFEYRVESALRGGNDYITKPFLYMELAVKALCFVIRGPIKRTPGTNDLHHRANHTVFSRRDLNALKQALLGSFDQKSPP